MRRVAVRSVAEVQARQLFSVLLLTVSSRSSSAQRKADDMAALNGKWRLVSLENFEPYLDAVGMYLCFVNTFFSLHSDFKKKLLSISSFSWVFR